MAKSSKYSSIHYNSYLQLDKLLDAQKECIQLFYLQSFSYKQIVDKTQHPLNKVKSYIQNGKRNLKNCIENTGARA